MDLVSSHLREVQDVLGRPYLVENPSTYVGFAGSTMTEAHFLRELVHRTGCRLLCDVSNVHVSAHNMGYDPYKYIDELPADAIDESHLGGFAPEPDEAKPGAQLLVDTHATAVDRAAWDVYAYATRRFGTKPTLIEWDNDLPSVEALLGEAAQANVIIEAVVSEEPEHAPAR